MILTIKIKYQPPLITSRNSQRRKKSILHKPPHKASPNNLSNNKLHLIQRYLSKKYQKRRKNRNLNLLRNPNDLAHSYNLIIHPNNNLYSQ